MKETIFKAIGITENDPITGVKYGLVDADKSSTILPIKNQSTLGKFIKTQNIRTGKQRAENTKKK